MTPGEVAARIHVALSETHPHLKPMVTGHGLNAVFSVTGVAEERDAVRKAAILAGLAVMCDACWESRGITVLSLEFGIDCLERANPPIFDCGQEQR